MIFTYLETINLHLDLPVDILFSINIRQNDQCDSKDVQCVMEMDFSYEISPDWYKKFFYYIFYNITLTKKNEKEKQ